MKTAKKWNFGVQINVPVNNVKKSWKIWDTYHIKNQKQKEIN